MAKPLLWMIMVANLIALIFDTSGDDLLLRITMYSSVAVLAICESIEKIGGKK